MQEGYYWVRYVGLGIAQRYEPEIARWNDELGTWHCTGDEVAYDPADFTIMSGPINATAPVAPS